VNIATSETETETQKAAEVGAPTSTTTPKEETVAQEVPRPAPQTATTATVIADLIQLVDGEVPVEEPEVVAGGAEVRETAMIDAHDAALRLHVEEDAATT